MQWVEDTATTIATDLVNSIASGPSNLEASDAGNLAVPYTAGAPFSPKESVTGEGQTFTTTSSAPTRCELACMATLGTSMAERTSVMTFF